MQSFIKILFRFWFFLLSSHLCYVAAVAALVIFVRRKGFSVLNGGCIIWVEYLCLFILKAMSLILHVDRHSTAIDNSRIKKMQNSWFKSISRIRIYADISLHTFTDGILYMKTNEDWSRISAFQSIFEYSTRNANLNETHLTQRRQRTTLLVQQMNERCKWSKMVYIISKRNLCNGLNNSLRWLP